MTTADVKGTPVGLKTSWLVTPEDRTSQTAIQVTLLNVGNKGYAERPAFEPENRCNRFRFSLPYTSAALNDPNYKSCANC